MILGDNGNIYRLVQDGRVSLNLAYIDSRADSPGLPCCWTTRRVDGTYNLSSAQNGRCNRQLPQRVRVTTVYGMVGNDVLFGEGQNDDLIGGYGHGGSRAAVETIILGRRWASTQAAMARRRLFMASRPPRRPPSALRGRELQQATLHVTGVLQKSVPAPFNPWTIWPASLLC